MNEDLFLLMFLDTKVCPRSVASLVAPAAGVLWGASHRLPSQRRLGCPVGGPPGGGEGPPDWGPGEPYAVREPLDAARGTTQPGLPGAREYALCIYMCTYMCTYMYLYVCTYMCTYMCTYVCNYMYNQGFFSCIIFICFEYESRLGCCHVLMFRNWHLGVNCTRYTWHPMPVYSCWSSSSTCRACRPPRSAAPLPKTPPVGVAGSFP